MFQGRSGKITPKTQERLGDSPVLALFFQLSLPYIWLTHPHKKYIFETIKDRAIISQRLVILTFKIINSGSISKLPVFSKVSSMNG